MSQGGPVWFVLDPLGAGLGTGDNQPVEIAVPQPIDRLVVLRCVAPPFWRARYLGQRKNPQRHLAPPGGAGQQVADLQFGELERRIRHVVDEADRDRAGASRRPLLRQPFDDSGGHRYSAHCARAWSRSETMSSTCSIPTLRRIISGVTPAFFWSAGGIWRCVVEAG